MKFDSKSFASYQLVLYDHAQELSVGTGFIVEVDRICFLLTNYHVLSGRHPETNIQLGNAIPDRLLVPLLRQNSSEPRWRPVVQSLSDPNGNPLWSEHPRLGSRFDVVAIPIHIPADCQAVPYSAHPGPEMALYMGSEVAIIGFPEGMAAPGITALWKTGTIASEPNLRIENEEYFWIDANTRSGMSGSPVIARRFGTVPLESGGVSLYAGGPVDRSIGVYAGRAYNAPDMTLGRVWKWSGVQEVIETALSKYSEGILRSKPCHLGYYRDIKINMIELDIHKNVNITAINQQGVSVNFPYDVASIFRDFILNDGRFGINLERVKLSASIETNLNRSLVSNTPFELTEEQHSLVREALLTPTNMYNPALARQILPLVEYIIAPYQNPPIT